MTHVDWSLPIVLPGTPHDGKFVLQSCDTALDLLYWDPTTGEAGPDTGNAVHLCTGLGAKMAGRGSALD